ncbi:MAG: hypothetical protein Q7J98_02290 [Kiritimatiellia bacterium]|nr:hypothetical protein [Kiritimatiellia bacterium]
MRSKAEIIAQELIGLRVLDIGGSGYGGDNPYERELQHAWRGCRTRTTVDAFGTPDILIDFNKLPLPKIEGAYDIATAFDVIEHLDHPVDVLRWIPAPKLIITLPNALSWIARRIEAGNNVQHLYSFTKHTAMVLLKRSGWRPMRCEYQLGKWSIMAKCINFIGSLCPPLAGTGIVIYCERQSFAQ